MRPEHLAVALLRERFATSAEGISLGIGDDAAILAPIGEPIVWTVDAQVEGTHFRPDWVSFTDVGYRSFMAAASDLAAMGAEPVGALSSLCLPRDLADGDFDALIEGQAEAARLVGAPIIGGNLARGAEISITTTLLGRTASPIRRSGGVVGHAVYVAGDLGLAAAGLALLEAGSETVVEARMRPCLEAWRRPVARIDAGRSMRGRASAATDVSDGLAIDARHIAEASEVTLVLEETLLDDLAAPALHAAADELARSPLTFILAGGEDYALLATSAEPLVGFARVGVVEPRSDARVLLRRRSGAREAVGDGGFDHFAK